MTLALLQVTGSAQMQDDPRWSIADPICTFVFAALVLLTTRAILRDISDILMERVPRNQNPQAITAGLFAVRCFSHSLACCTAHRMCKLSESGRSGFAWQGCVCDSFQDVRFTILRIIFWASLGSAAPLASALPHPAESPFFDNAISECRLRAWWG